MAKKILVLVELLAIAAGLLAIFKIVTNIEAAIGFVTVSFGVLAVIWTLMAVKSLSPGSALRKYVTNFLLCLIFILLFAVWHTLSIIFEWRKTLNEAWLYPGYLFITIAFLIFVATAYQVLTMGKEFGFRSQADKIKKVIEEKKKRKSNQ